ncbi:hypothetical protein [Sphingobium sp. Z007]|uniref:hypothetical protein n=1 Tax=Sphingobium sp. Z007 TaxID=627495 RepID=UPI000B499508|nr:hypothetical protein [Sphingobium sp. Z007]
MSEGELFSRLTQFADNAIAKLKVSSALSSALWLCAFVLPFSFFGIWLFDGYVEVCFLTLMFLAVGNFVVNNLYFTFTDPDKLRSEEYELRRLALGLIEEKGGTIPVSESSVEVIANAEYRPLCKSTDSSDQ